MADRARELNSMLPVRLAVETHDDLRREAERRGCSASALARQAIVDLLEKDESSGLQTGASVEQSQTAKAS